MAYSKMFEVAVLQRVCWYTSKNTDKLLLDLEIGVSWLALGETCF